MEACSSDHALSLENHELILAEAPQPGAQCELAHGAVALSNEPSVFHETKPFCPLEAAGFWQPARDQEPNHPARQVNRDSEHSNHEPVKLKHLGIPVFPSVKQGPPNIHYRLNLVPPAQVSSSVTLNVPKPVLQPDPALFNISFGSMALHLGDLDCAPAPGKNRMLNNGSKIPILK